MEKPQPPEKVEAPKCVCTMVDSNKPNNPFGGSKLVSSFMVVIITPMFHFTIAILSFLLGYLVYGTLDGAIRVVAFVYILMIALMVQATPVLGLLLTIPYIIFFSQMYDIILGWCGIVGTTLTFVIMVLEVIAGTLVAITTFSVGVSTMVHGSIFAQKAIFDAMMNGMPKGNPDR